MNCKNCELNKFRINQKIDKKHCKECMSSFYMVQAKDYCNERLKNIPLTEDETKAIIYDKVKKAVNREVRIFTKRRLYLSNDLLNTAVIQEITTQPNVIKLNRVIEDSLEASNLSDISCVVKNKESGHSYNVTLNSCTCRDFVIHKRPCKHMYRLAMAIGIIDPPIKINEK